MADAHARDSRRDLRLLAVHSGTMSGGGLGIDAENAIKDHRPRSATLRKIAVEIRTVLEGARHHRHPGAALLGQPTIKIDIDRQRAARYGLSPGDINATIQAAVGGQAAGDLTRKAATAISR